VVGEGEWRQVVRRGKTGSGEVESGGKRAGRKRVREEGWKEA
tara:strand:- start:923 stop:1048 length:126 start_codon:yes stop_codon:yes gene_type:complete